MKKLIPLFLLIICTKLTFANFDEFKVGDTFEYRIEDFTTIKIRFQQITVKDGKSTKEIQPDQYFDVYIVADLNFKVIEKDNSSTIIEVKPKYFSYYSNSHEIFEKTNLFKINHNSEIQKPNPYISLFYPLFSKESFKIQLTESEIIFPPVNFDTSLSPYKSRINNPATFIGKDRSLLRPILEQFVNSPIYSETDKEFTHRIDSIHNYRYSELLRPDYHLSIIYKGKEKLPYKCIAKSFGNISENREKYLYSVIKKIENKSSSFKTKYYPSPSKQTTTDTIIQKPNTVLTGVINPLKNFVQIQIKAPDYIENNTRLYHAECDEKGKFILKLNINEPTEFTIDWKQHGILIPGDSIIYSETIDGCAIDGIDSDNSIFYNDYLKQAVKFRVHQKPLTHFFDSTQYCITPSVWLKAYYDYRYLKFNIDYSDPLSNKKEQISKAIDLDNDLMASSEFYTQEGIEKLDIWGIEKIKELNATKGINFNKNDIGFEVYSYIALNYSGLTECLLKYYWVKHTWKNELDHKKAEMILKRFLEEYPNSKYSQNIEEFIRTYDTIKKGTKAPDFQLKNTDDKTINLSDYKGKVVYLVFWSYDESILNEDFRIYNPILQQLKSDKNIEVLLVDCSQKNFQSRSIFIEENLENFQNFNLNKTTSAYKNISSILKITSLPRAVIIDKNGDIFNYHAPLFIFSKDLSEEIDEALKIPTKTKAMLYKISMFLPLIIILILIVFISYSARKNRKIKFNKRINEVKLKAIRSQMNPHFIFNSLNSIQGLVNTNKKEEANLYLSKFAMLLRNVLENSESPYISLSEELEAVKTYCELEKMRVDFDYEFIVDPAININEIEISGMLIQPLIENAIVHGLAPKSNNRQLKLTIKQKNNYLIITVADNGNGLPDNQTDHLREKGFGLKLIEERMHLLEQEKKKAHLEILPYGIDKEQGTTVKLIFPIY